MAQLRIIESYSEKAFAIVGDTRPHKDVLLEHHGKFNTSLKDGDEKIVGFIFSKRHLEEMRQVVDQINSGESLQTLSYRSPVPRMGQKISVGDKAMIVTELLTHPPPTPGATRLKSEPFVHAFVAKNDSDQVRVGCVADGWYVLGEPVAI